MEHSGTYHSPVHRRSTIRDAGSGKARRTKRKNGGKVSPGTVKLTICAVIFIIAACVKLAFPGEAEKVRDGIAGAIAYNVDYKSAITALGEAFSGEKEVKEALGEAYEYAFGGEMESAG